MIELSREFTETCNNKHRSTVAYSCWANGTVERLDRNVRAALRSTIAKRKRAARDWVFIINILPSFLSKLPCERLGEIDNKTT